MSDKQLLKNFIYWIIQQDSSYIVRESDEMISYILEESDEIIKKFLNEINQK